MADTAIAPAPHPPLPAPLPPAETASVEVLSDPLDVASPFISHPAQVRPPVVPTVPTVPTSLYSYNSHQMIVSRRRYQLLRAGLLLSIPLVLIIGYIAWVTIGSPTSLRDIPLINNLL